MGLSKGVYVMGPWEIPCLIKRGDKEHPINFQDYLLMKDFRHNNAVFIENFFMDDDAGCLILSNVSGSLEACLRKNASIAFVKECNEYKFSSVLRGLIIEICQVVESLMKLDLYPRNISMDNMCLIYNGNMPVMKVLIYDVENTKGFSDAVKSAKSKIVYDKVKLMVNKICEDLGRQPLHITTKCFIDYIGGDTTSKLNRYPDVWTDEDKEWYLYCIDSADRRRVGPPIRSLWEDSGWPKTPDGAVQPLLERLRAEERTYFRVYDTSDPIDYLRLARNVIKHWVKYKGLPADRAGFLRLLEEWTPGIWCKIYNAVGMP
uniref:Protein kinase domain-containing protein n=1 Tax=Leersia perrieri TaxID=77586 RepID=A0A0D9VAR8_9ORYZ